MYNIYIYIYIYIIAAINIITSTAGLSLKYNSQMVRSGKSPIACYKNTVSTSSNLKNLFFSSINVKMSINKYFLCDSSYFFIKSRLNYMSEKQMYCYKRLQSIYFYQLLPIKQLHSTLILSMSVP